MSYNARGISNTTYNPRIPAYTGFFPMNICPEDRELYACYSLECDPERSLWLAVQHFKELENRATAHALAESTAAHSGKTVAPAKIDGDNHWLLTVYGIQWWDIASRYRGALYGGIFTTARFMKRN